MSPARILIARVTNHDIRWVRLPNSIRQEPSAEHRPGVTRCGVARNDLRSYINMDLLARRRADVKHDFPRGEGAVLRSGRPKPTHSKKQR